MLNWVRNIATRLMNHLNKNSVNMTELTDIFFCYCTAMGLTINYTSKLVQAGVVTNIFSFMENINYMIAMSFVLSVLATIKLVMLANHPPKDRKSVTMLLVASWLFLTSMLFINKIYWVITYVTPIITLNSFFSYLVLSVNSNGWGEKSKDLFNNIVEP